MKTATHYGQLRASLQQQGITLNSLDLLIAAHADHLNMVMVTSDKAFQNITSLEIENWYHI